MSDEMRMSRELFRPINRNAVEEVAMLISVVGQLKDLMAESGGVYGLHLNGAGAPWDELTGTWLNSAPEAFAVIERLTHTRARQALERNQS